MGEVVNFYGVLIGKSEENRPLRKFSADGSTILE
jgi:hypothetical protein